MIYTKPSIASAAAYISEVFVEVRCPACVPLGWFHSRLLFKVYGKIEATGATLQTHCHRCKSLIVWTIGAPKLDVIEYGPKNNRQQKVSFE